MKKRVILITIIGLFMLMLPLMANADPEIVDSGTCEDNLTWTLDDTGTLTIDGTGYMKNWFYWNSTAPWFSNRLLIKSVIINNGITSIGDFAFQNCSNLTSVTIPDSVTSIGIYAFNECSALKKIIIPDGITSIADSTFYNCSNLKSITIPDDVTSVGNYAFYRCNSLTDITLPNGVTSIGNCAFLGCKGLLNITIPDSVISIGNSAFSECENLVEVAIPNGVTCINDSVFLNCYNLQNISIPDGITSIGKSAFNTCRKLQNITIPDSVMSIGESAFNNCGVLESITIPEGVTKIQNWTFGNCNMLKSISIPDSVTSFGDYALYGCHKLESLSIPDGVINIGDWAFGNCNNLKNIIIPNSITSIGDYAFYHCGILRLSVSGNLKTIGEYAFEGSGLISLSIPSSVTHIGDYAFRSCTKLMNITIHEGITSIGNEVFSNCSNLESITIPHTVYTFSSDAFQGCSKLNRFMFLHFPEDHFSSDGVTNIPTDATIYCYEQTDVETVFRSHGNPIILLDSLNMDAVRSLTIQDDFRITTEKTIGISYALFPDYDLPSQSILWSSSNPSVVSVDNGIITTHQKGNAVITASVGSLTANVRVTVYIPLESYEISPKEEWIVAGDSIQLNISNIQPIGAEVDRFTWASTDSSLATVDASSGLVNTLNPGDVKIGGLAVINGAIDAQGPIGECTLHICYPVTAIRFSESETTIILNEDYQATANVTMFIQRCVNHLVSFTSSDPEIATIDENGIVHGIKAGTTTITATADSGVTASMTVTVRNANVLQLPSGLTEIDDEAFSGSSCEVVIIPEGCTTIGDKAFAYCDKLVRVVIPASVKSYPTSAFEGCNENLVIDWEGH